MIVLNQICFTTQIMQLYLFAVKGYCLGKIQLHRARQVFKKKFALWGRTEHNDSKTNVIFYISYKSLLYIIQLLNKLLQCEQHDFETLCNLIWWMQTKTMMLNLHHDFSPGPSYPMWHHREPSKSNKSMSEINAGFHLNQLKCLKHYTNRSELPIGRPVYSLVPA